PGEVNPGVPAGPPVRRSFVAIGNKSEEFILLRRVAQPNGRVLSTSGRFVNKEPRSNADRLNRGQVHLQASPVQAAEKLFSLAQAFTPGELKAINSRASFRRLWHNGFSQAHT